MSQKSLQQVEFWAHRTMQCHTANAIFMGQTNPRSIFPKPPSPSCGNLNMKEHFRANIPHPTICPILPVSLKDKKRLTKNEAAYKSRHLARMGKNFQYLQFKYVVKSTLYVW